MTQLDLFATTNCDFEEQQKEQQEARHSDLTPRQWETYRLIYTNSLIYRRKTTQREIYENVRGYEWNDDEKCHDHCPTIWNDITANNLSFSHDKIIISKNFEYWIGNEEETQEFLDQLWQQLAPRLTRYWLYKQKVSKNGYGKLLSNDLKPITDDSKAREFIESYNLFKVGE